MNFRVKIAALRDGTGIIGAKAILEFKEDVVDTESVYGVQIGHRVITKTEQGPRIMTPSAAKRAGYTYQAFPPASW